MARLLIILAGLLLSSCVTGAPTREISHAPTMVWNRNIDGIWRISGLGWGDLGADSGAVHQWVWGSRGGNLFVLEKPKSGGRWQPLIFGLSGTRTPIDLPFNHTDGAWDCAAALARCLFSVIIEERRAIAEWVPGNPPRLFLSGDAQFSDPQFSSDSQHILFRSDQGGSWDLWSARSDGTHMRQLTNDPINDEVPAHFYQGEGHGRFSPDGRQISWTRRFPHGEFEIWTMNSDGSNKKRLTTGAYPDFDPGGTEIAFNAEIEGDQEIFIISAAGGEVRRVTRDPVSNLAPFWINR